MVRDRVEDSDIDSLTADAAQETKADPPERNATRTALAEALENEQFFHDEPRPTADEAAKHVAADLAERGVLLVTEERLAAAVDDAIGDVDPLAFGRSTKEQAMRETAAAIFAALSERQESAAVEGPEVTVNQMETRTP